MNQDDEQGVIDLRSDTATRPTPEMLEAMVQAPLGDEQRREDPTVRELEELAARLLGQAAAVYLPTATMGNQIGVRILTRPGDEMLAEESSHLFAAELAGAAVHSGLATRSIEAPSGRFTAEQVRAQAARLGPLPHARRRRCWQSRTPITPPAAPTGAPRSSPPSSTPPGTRG